MIGSRAEARKISGISQYAEGYIAETHPKWRSLVGMVLAFAAGLPLSLGNFRNRALLNGIRALIKREKIDAIIVFSSSMAPYAESEREGEAAGLGVRIMNFCDVDSQKWQDLADKAGGWRRWIYRREARLLARYEGRLDKEFDASCFVTAKEAELFRLREPDSRPLVLPNGVDAEFFGAMDRQPRPWHIVFVGVMDYAPNIEAVTYFAEEVWPRLSETFPQAKFTIVGGRPAPKVLALARQPSIEVTGYVEDVRPYLASASAVIVPLSVARGIQNKILEAMAAGVPVLTSAAAAAGLPPGALPYLTVCERGPGLWLRALEQLHLDPAHGEKRAGEGKDFIAKHMSWQASVDVLTRVLREKTAGKLAGKQAGKKDHSSPA